MDTTTSANPARQAISGLVSTIYKATASFQTVDATLPPLWQALLKLDLGAVQSAIRAGQDINQRNSSNDTPLLYIAREGHYKYPPADIPALLIQSGADLEAKDNKGRTALQVSGLITLCFALHPCSGCRNIGKHVFTSCGSAPA
jgi:hypothetical protein